MKTTLLIFVWTLLFPGISSEEVPPMRIAGRIPELTEGRMVLVAQGAAGVDTLGCAQITGGEFVLEAALEQAYIATLKVEGFEGGFMMITEPGEVYEAELYQSAPSSIRGGKQQEELLLYQQTVAEHNVRLRQLRNDIELATTERRFRTASELKKELETALADANGALNGIVERNRGNVFAAYILTDGMRRAELPVMKVNYEKLSPQERATQPGKLLASFIAGLERLDVGSQAPDFRLPDPDGRQTALYDLGGKLKVVDFWASWCGPCRMENPNMVALYSDYREKGLTIVSVSLDENREAWLKAIKDDGLAWTHLSSLEGWKSQAVTLYNVDAVPTIFVLDEENRIIGKNLRGEALRRFVSERLD